MSAFAKRVSARSERLRALSPTGRALPRYGAVFVYKTVGEGSRLFMNNGSPNALALLRSMGASLSREPSRSGVSDAWYAFDELKICLLRDSGRSQRETKLMRDLQIALQELTKDLQQQRAPDGDQVKMVIVALQSSLVSRSLASANELVLAESDMLGE